MTRAEAVAALVAVAREITNSGYEQGDNGWVLSRNHRKELFAALAAYDAAQAPPDCPSPTGPCGCVSGPSVNCPDSKPQANPVCATCCNFDVSCTGFACPFYNVSGYQRVKNPSPSCQMCRGESSFCFLLICARSGRQRQGGMCLDGETCPDRAPCPDCTGRAT